jgi:AraC-like DNA-binding protein
VSKTGHVDQHQPTATRRLAGGARIERHRHDEHQLVYVSSGVVAVTAGRGTWLASSDRAIWVPLGYWHEHRFYGESTFHCVGLEPHENPLRLTEPAVVGVTPLLRELVIACAAPDGHAREEYARLRAVLLDQLRHSPQRPLYLPTPRDARLAAACRIVADDLTVGWTLAALGRRVGTGERTLTRLFRAEMGMSYPQWRTQLRLYHAMLLLAESVPVTVVARRTGWATPSAFIDVYRRTFGHTPGSFPG